MPDLPAVAPYAVKPVTAAFKDANGDPQYASATTPLPIEARRGASGVTPLAGSTSSTGVLGPFTPQLGRPIQLSLRGTWSGSVTVKRSVDGGSNKFALTAGGYPWASFTTNACEPVAEENEAGATYYLDVVLVSGTLTYRMAQ